MAQTYGNTPKTLSPSKLAHVVLNTNANFERMKQFYKAFLGATPSHEAGPLCFLSYDEEHHRIALIQMPNLQEARGGTVGLAHIAFTFDSLKDLCTAYKQRKALRIEPGWCTNHGPTTSMYYQDPDGNTLETQVDNFDSLEDATAFMTGSQFAKNPIGADFDPEDLCKAVESGEDERKLKVRKDIGERGGPEVLEYVVGQMNTAKAGV